jgi:NAD-dependent dihydropyrimidine dehydrogenase PreA subunit
MEGEAITTGVESEEVVYTIDQEKCKKVADCVEACPIAAIEMKGDGAFNVSDDCTDCGACEPVCDTKAIQCVQ